MAIITGLTAAEMRAIEANSIVDGDVVGDNLILTKHNGTTVNAGNVRGPVGADASVHVAYKLVTDLPSAYPVGISTMTISAETGWPTTYGVVTTVLESSNRAYQTIVSKNTSTMWIRSASPTDNNWGVWIKLADDARVDGLEARTNGADTVANPDLNNYQTGGKYTVSLTAWATGGLNFPEGVAGLLEVGANVGSSHVWQRYTPYGVGMTHFYVRTYYSGYAAGSQWSPWRRFDMTATLTAADLLARRVELAQRVFSGGGVRSVTATGIGWATRFILMGLGKNAAFASSGYFEITMPADGTVITGYGGAANVTVAAGEIPLANNRALYYELPVGGVQTSQAANFRIVDYAASMIDIPANWILIALASSDPTRLPRIMWGDGLRQDYWKLLTLTNSWVAYGSNWPAPSWRFTHDGKIILRGLMKSGTSGVSVAFVTFSADLAPDGVTSVGSIYMQPSSTGHARVDVSADGKCCVLSYIGTGGNSFVSLEGISWYPNGS